MPVNQNFAHLSESFFFSAIGHRALQYEQQHPERRLIRLSIGDVTRPLCPAVVEALERAAQEMGRAETFRGYGPEQGYSFLRTAIAGYYEEQGIHLETDEIFISDGAKSDLGNILEEWASEKTAGIIFVSLPSAHGRMLGKQ